MNLPDPSTILLMATLMAVAMSVVLYSAHLNFPKEIQGLRDWALALVLLVGGVVMFALHGKSNILLLFANIVMTWGLGLMMIGTERFYEIKPSWRLFHLSWILIAVLLGYWLWIKPDFITRVAISSLVVFTLHVRAVGVILKYGDGHFSMWFFVTLMIIESIMVAVRGILAVTSDSDVNLLGTGTFASLYLATAQFMTLMMTVGFMTVCTRRLQVTLERRSTLDPLTEVLNRRGFADIYAKEHALMRREGTFLTMLNIDIDYFKKINDSHGHAVGDRVLIDVAQVITKALRASDHLARFGGEEFVVLLPATGLDRALHITERIRTALRSPRADVPPYTVSVGVACQTSAEESLDGILARADKALYCAKERGRDRYEIAPEAVFTGTSVPIRHQGQARA
ncbi:diguanylate cyclase (GGDEF)-like protein [Duganella sp. SG902]|uniref:GGDEF domain-containing protein n=1 Tax=Duganella sp. SG902 TaxID=2587016 RepID=UPI0017D7A907|nr:GGDEF domain-containing protein [Duganella sp. SG902]NVM77956.1 diguanylate cyclase (GGDEF)-like protein [Duganella sp. SG902]